MSIGFTCFKVDMVLARWCLVSTRHLVFRSNTYFCFFRPENVMSHGLRVVRVPFWQTSAGLSSGEWFPSGHSILHWLSTAEMVVLLEQGWATPGPSGSRLLLVMDDGGYCAHWGLQFFKNVSVSQYNHISEVYRQFLGFHQLVCALTCNVNYCTWYRLVCGFPNHAQSTEFTTGILESSGKNMWHWISGNRKHLSSILRAMAKAVNTYVHVIFFFFFL